MAYAGIETTLELWASSLREVKARMRPLFTQERVAASAGRFLEVLLSDERRKTGWMRAEAAGDPGPWRQQAILGRGHWDAEALRDLVREYVLEHLADPDAVLVVDETGFLKQGKASVGVARSTPAQRARSPIARLACSPPTSAATATPSSIGRYTCRRPGRRMRSVERRRMCRARSASSPSPLWRGE